MHGEGGGAFFPCEGVDYLRSGKGRKDMKRKRRGEDVGI